MFVSYAQNFEDVMLWRALKHVANGFYLDIGAQDPVVDSVSRGFYEKGWRGIHLEPTSHYAAKLRENRPDETVVQSAVGDGAGAIRFFEFPDTGLSTGDAEVAAQHRANDFRCVETEVELVSLAAVFDRANGRDIHWMKIDVEGMEASVLESWSDSPVRPWIVVVESTVPLTSERVATTWQYHLTDRGYEQCYFDGLNEYFIASGREELKAAFGTPPNVFDRFALSGTATSPASSRMVKLAHDLKDAAHVQADLQDQLDQASAKHTADLEREIAVQSQLLAAQAQLEHARRRELELNQVIFDSCRQSDHLHAQIVALYGSFSWRAMMPYRVAARLFKRVVRVLAGLPHRLIGVVGRGLYKIMLKLPEYVRSNPRAYSAARRLIARYPWLRTLPERVRQMRRSKEQPAQTMLTPANDTQPRAFEISDQDLSALTRIGRINAAQIRVR